MMKKLMLKYIYLSKTQSNQINLTMKGEARNVENGAIVV